MAKFSEQIEKSELDVGRLSYVNAYRYQKKAIIAEVEKSLWFESPKAGSELSGD